MTGQNKRQLAQDSIHQVNQLIVQEAQGKPIIPKLRSKLYRSDHKIFDHRREEQQSLSGKIPEDTRRNSEHHLPR